MGIFLYMAKKEGRELADILKDGGYHDLYKCSSLDEVKKKLNLGEYQTAAAAYPTDLFILDISMERDAILLCKEIKQIHAYHEIPVIILSSNSAAETFQMAFAYGASDFIAKPIRGYELLTRVRSALKMKHEIDRRKSRERELLEVTRQLSDLNTVLNRLSLIDSLTGIPNRRCFDQSLDQEIRLCMRNNRPLSLILIDIDYFKLYNDAYGHQAGDHCLKTVAQCISGCLRRPSDLIARYGGEEFAAVLPDTNGEGAVFIAEKIQTTIKGVCIPHGESKASDRVTVSQGLATFLPQLQVSKEVLIESADKALYEAKEGGRNCLRQFDFSNAITSSASSSGESA